jgi:hypothetical protein
MPPFGPMAGRRRRVDCASNPFGCPSLAAKGRRSRLTATCQLPCHQRKFSGRPFRAFRKGVPLLKFYVARFAFAFLIIISVSSAHASSPQSNSSAAAPQPVCGQSVDAALNAARAALAANDAANDRAALGCAVAALAALDHDLQALEQGRQPSGVLKLPQHANANQQSP